MSEASKTDTIAANFVKKVLAGQAVSISDLPPGVGGQAALEMARGRIERFRKRATQRGLVGRAWTSGEVLVNRYRVIRPLGSGGMGEVYLVERLHDKRRFAAKKVRDKHGGAFDPVATLTAVNPKQLTFLAEIMRSMRIAPHPNVLRCRFFDIIDGGLVLFTRHVHGGNLAEACRLRLYGPPLPPHVRFMSVALQVLSGLTHLHSNGIIHQDIKPENILVARCGRQTLVRITDFGIARQSQHDRNGQLIPVRVAGLDERFASPEQFSGTKVDDRTDLFSWARAMLAVLPGRRAETTPVSVTTKLQIRQALPSGLDSSVRDALSDALWRCLAPDPGTRPSSSDLFEQIRHLPGLPQAAAHSLGPSHVYSHKRRTKQTQDQRFAATLSAEFFARVDPDPNDAAWSHVMCATSEPSIVPKPTIIKNELRDLSRKIQAVGFSAASYSDRRKLAQLRLAYLLNRCVGDQKSTAMLMSDARRLLNFRGEMGMNESADKLGQALGFEPLLD